MPLAEGTSRKLGIQQTAQNRSFGKLTAIPKSRHTRSAGVSPRRRHRKRLPQETRSDRPGSSRGEAAAFVAGRARGKQAASGGTESRRGHQKRKVRAQPEPLDKPRPSCRRPQAQCAGTCVSDRDLPGPRFRTSAWQSRAARNRRTTSGARLVGGLEPGPGRRPGDGHSC